MNFVNALWLKFLQNCSLCWEKVKAVRHRSTNIIQLVSFHRNLQSSSSTGNLRKNISFDPNILLIHSTGSYSVGEQPITHCSPNYVHLLHPTQANSFRVWYVPRHVISVVTMIFASHEQSRRKKLVYRKFSISLTCRQPAFLPRLHASGTTTM